MTVPQQVREIIDYAERKIKRVADMDVSLYPRPKEPAAWFTWEQLCIVVCYEVGVEIKSVSTKWRKREVVLARHLIWYYGTAYKLGTLSDLGHRLCRVDHSTVIHAVAKLKGLIETGDEIVYEAMTKIDTALEALKPKENADQL